MFDYYGRSNRRKQRALNNGADAARVPAWRLSSAELCRRLAGYCNPFGVANAHLSLRGRSGPIVPHPWQSDRARHHSSDQLCRCHPVSGLKQLLPGFSISARPHIPKSDDDHAVLDAPGTPLRSALLRHHRTRVSAYPRFGWLMQVLPEHHGGSAGMTALPSSAEVAPHLFPVHDLFPEQVSTVKCQ